MITNLRMELFEALQCTILAAAAVHPLMIQWPYFHVADADIYAEKTLLMILEIQKRLTQTHNFHKHHIHRLMVHADILSFFP